MSVYKDSRICKTCFAGYPERSNKHFMGCSKALQNEELHIVLKRWNLKIGVFF